MSSGRQASPLLMSSTTLKHFSSLNLKEGDKVRAYTPPIASVLQLHPAATETILHFLESTEGTLVPVMLGDASRDFVQHAHATHRFGKPQNQKTISISVNADRPSSCRIPSMPLDRSFDITGTEFNHWYAERARQRYKEYHAVHGSGGTGISSTGREA